MEADVDLAKVVRTDNGTNARVIVLQLKGYGSTAGSATGTTGDASAETIDGTEWAQPLGLVSRPQLSDTTEAIILRIDDQAIAIHVIDKGGPAVTIEEGGTILHGAKERTAQIYIRANGSIEVTAKTGQDVVVNAGTQKVARVNDQVLCGSLSVVTANVSGVPVVTGITYTDPDGGVHVLTPGVGTVLQGLSGKINTGADHFKG